MKRASVPPQIASIHGVTLPPDPGPVGKVPTDLEGCDDEADEAGDRLYVFRDLWELASIAPVKEGEKITKSLKSGSLSTPFIRVRSSPRSAKVAVPGIQRMVEIGDTRLRGYAELLQSYARWSRA